MLGQYGAYPPGMQPGQGVQPHPVQMAPGPGYAPAPGQLFYNYFFLLTSSYFSALTLLVGRHEGHLDDLACKNCWRGYLS